MNKKKDLKILKFPNTIAQHERQVEAILFAAEEPLSIENIHYEIQGTGKINLYWDAEVDEEILELNGYGNYGLISSEKNKEISSTTSIPNGDVLLTSDSNVKKYNLILEFKKETGFTAS